MLAHLPLLRRSMGPLTKWLFFNLAFGCIPYALVAALNQLQAPGSTLLHPSSEVLFIAVVATSSALGELWDRDDEHTRFPVPLRGRPLAQLVLLMGVVSSGLLYGAYAYHTFKSPGRAYAIDCSVVALVDGAAFADARALCGGWVRIPAGFFRWSACRVLGDRQHPGNRLLPLQAKVAPWKGMSGFSRSAARAWRSPRP